MMVESACGNKALLGRAKRCPVSCMLSCLTGFVEQAESVEEACKRKVKEEAGIVIEHVDIVGSQPWPMGRCCSAVSQMYSCLVHALAHQLSTCAKFSWQIRSAVSRHCTPADLHVG